MVAWSSPSDSTKWYLAAVATAACVAGALYTMSQRRRKEREEAETRYELVGKVSDLIVYPIKSCAGMSLQEATVTQNGLKTGALTDRHFLITRENADFLTQRQITLMGSVKPRIEGDHLVLCAKAMAIDLRVPLKPTPDPKAVKSCRVFSSRIDGQDLGDEASAWLSEVLQEPGVRLFTHTPGMGMRQSTRGTAQPVDKVAYQDDSPLLVASEGSLADLVTRVPPNDGGAKVTMTNFRPNIVLSGSKAWQEDEWRALKIGDKAKIRVNSPCDRCLLTTVDPESHKRRSDGEPLKTLKSFRIFPEISTTSPMFGVFAGVDVQATVKVGDPVYALRK